MVAFSVLSVISAVFFVVVYLSGVWLRKSGGSYNHGRFAVHKLSVITAILLIVAIYVLHLNVFNFRGTGLVLFLISDLFLVIAFITGVLLSFDKFSSIGLKIIHRTMSWISVIFVPVIWVYCH